MRLLVLPVLFVAVGCGSDAKKPMLLDSKVFLDAGVDAAPVCGVKAMFGGLTLGTAAAPAGVTPAQDWYDVGTVAPNVGKTILSIGANLPDSTATLRDVFVMEYVKPNTGFALNTAVPFNPDPHVAGIAYAYIIGDFDTTSMMSANFYFASSGGMTLSAANDVDGSLTTGSMSATNLRDIDDNNDDIVGGCTTMMTGLSFNLKQTTIAPTFQDGGLPDLSPEAKRAIGEKIARFKQTERFKQMTATATEE